MDLPNGKKAIGTKWVYRNKKDERGIMIKNKVRLVAQGYTKEEGIDYEEVFALVDRIEAIRLFLAYASFKDFVYQMDINSAFLYGKIEEEVYVCQPPGFKDPDFPNIDSPFDLVAYTDSDHVGASLYRKSTIGGCQFLWYRLISWQCKKHTVVANSITEAEYIAASNCCGQICSPKHLMLADFNILLQVLECLTSEVLIKGRKDNEIPQSSGPTEHIADEVTNEEHVPTQSNDLPLSRVNTLGSREDRLSLKELMDLCIKLSDRVLDLETTKTTQALEIDSLKRRSDAEKDASQQKREENKADKDADAEEVEVETVIILAEVTTKSATTTTVDELTLAQTLIEIKAAKPKVRGVMIKELSEFTTTTTTTTPAASKPLQDKGKVKMTESEKPLKKKDQIMYDQELKSFKFEVIKDMFDKAFKRVNTFVDYKTELVEGSEKRADDSTKRAGTKLEQEVAKKQKIDDAKVDDDHEEARMKELMNIVLDEECNTPIFTI
ncbi:putative ribonuclease H-like domain-containing protein [Tanacetum coccineum]